MSSVANAEAKFAGHRFKYHPEAYEIVTKWVQIVHYAPLKHTRTHIINLHRKTHNCTTVALFYLEGEILISKFIC
jgi:hypothetical protein